MTYGPNHLFYINLWWVGHIFFSFSPFSFSPLFFSLSYLLLLHVGTPWLGFWSLGWGSRGRRWRGQRRQGLGQETSWGAPWRLSEAHRGVHGLGEKLPELHGQQWRRPRWAHVEGLLQGVGKSGERSRGYTKVLRSSWGGPIGLRG